MNVGLIEIRKEMCLQSVAEFCSIFLKKNYGYLNH